MDILCLYWMGFDRQVDEVDDCHYLANAPGALHRLFGILDFDIWWVFLKLDVIFWRWDLIGRWMKQMIVITRRMHHLFRPQQLLSIFQTGEKLQTPKRSANRRFAFAVKKQTSNPSITQF